MDDFVLAAYRRKGHEQVRSLGDIAALSLEDVERVVGAKRFQEVIKGAGEGALAGFYGAAGAAVDVPALLALALRSVNVFAYSYGFDPTTDEGRAYALSIIDASAGAVGCGRTSRSRARASASASAWRGRRSPSACSSTYPRGSWCASPL